MSLAKETGATGINEVVSIEREGAIALIALDNPPVNAASHALRSGIWQALKTLLGDSSVEAIALYAKGRTFITGADIREFGKPPQQPVLPAVIDEYEASDKPVIAAIHGTALGGGLEVALGCDYRRYRQSHVARAEGRVRALLHFLRRDPLVLSLSKHCLFF